MGRQQNAKWRRRVLNIMRATTVTESLRLWKLFRHHRRYVRLKSQLVGALMPR